MKSFLESWTIWLNVIVAILLTLSTSSQPFVELFPSIWQASLTEYIAYGGVIANWWVRFKTTTGIAFKPPVAS